MKDQLTIISMETMLRGKSFDLSNFINICKAYNVKWCNTDVYNTLNLVHCLDFNLLPASFKNDYKTLINNIIRFNQLKLGE